MVQLPITIKVRNDRKAERKLNSLKGSVSKLKRSFVSSFGGMKAPIALLGVLTTEIVAFTAASAAAIVATIEFSKQLEHQNAVMSRSSGTVTAAADALGGTVSNLDLMIGRNRILQSGIQLSTRDFVAFEKVVRDYSFATGETATSATIKLSRAIAGMSARQLRVFGLNLKTTGSQASQTADLFRQLRDRAANLNPTINTLGGAILKLGIDIQNLKTRILQVVGANKGLITSFQKLTDNIIELLVPIVDLRSSMGAATTAGVLFSASLEVGIKLAKRYVDVLIGVRDALTSFDTSSAIAAIRRFGDAAFNVSSDIQAAFDRIAKQMADLDEQRREQERQARTVINRPNDDPVANLRRQRELQKELARLIALELATNAEILADQDKLRQGRNTEITQIQEAVSLEREKVRLGITQNLLLTQRAAIAEEEDTKNKRKQLANLEFQDELKRRREAVLAVQESLNLASQSAIGLAGAALRVNKKTDETMQQARLRSIKHWLKNFAIRQAFKGGADLAAGIANVVENPPSAAAHFAGAAKHFALAAAAGGSAAAIGFSGGAGRGKKSEADSFSRQKAQTPVSNVRSITINIQGQSILDEATIGTSIRRALEAENRRF